MSLIPIDQAHIQQILQNDTQQMRTLISWVSERYVAYNQNMSTEHMTAAGISAGDQTAILAFIADIARLNQFVTGTLPAVAADIRVDVANVLGVM